MLKKAILVIILAATASQAMAQQASDKPAAAPSDSRGSDKLDIKKLEQKYWAAKDDDFSVVQNRRYTKAERFFFSAVGGTPINDPFAKGTIFGAQVGYFFNERWGVDVAYNKGNFEDGDSTHKFKTSLGGTSPDYNFFESSILASVTFVPLYAKMSFMDKHIIYFDMGFSLGAGTLDYSIQRDTGSEAKNTFAYKVGVTQQIFFAEHFALRLDFNNTWAEEDRKPYTAANPAQLGSSTVNDTSLLIGFTYWH
ncbi:outer membrane beta-barrel domain-containing protein [Bdellovibrio sp. HCB2-146]|uniref:outer membrane beta-barrel domain-containing protein n=1 Tax=Bdellovibrio sp. HCB2-146 TaxID=3394362 RepID=UPI0039BC91D5